jgi:hypothetical protein
MHDMAHLSMLHTLPRIFRSFYWPQRHRHRCSLVSAMTMAAQSKETILIIKEQGTAGMAIALPIS